MAGMHPFFLKNGQLCLTFHPILPAWLFDENNEVSFTFLGRTQIIYHNPHRRDTFEPQTSTRYMVLRFRSGESLELTGAVIPALHAKGIRGGQITQIDVYFD